jgi:hypothetical protein
MPVSKNNIFGPMFDWASCKFSFLGNLDVIGITAFQVTKTVTKEKIYGSGAEPISIGRGQAEYTGSMTLYAEEAMRLAAISPNNDPTQLPPFTIVVTSIQNGRAFTIEVVAEIRNWDFSVAQGQSSIPIPIELEVISVQPRNILT